MAVTEPIELVTGWEPEVPVGDTVLRRFVHAWAESLAGPVAAVGGRVQRRDGLVISDLGRPAAYYNGATLLRPPAPDEWRMLVDRSRRCCLRAPTPGTSSCRAPGRPRTCGVAAGSWKATRRCWTGPRRSAAPGQRPGGAACHRRGGARGLGAGRRGRLPIGRPGAVAAWGAVRSARARQPTASVGGVHRRGAGRGRRFLCRPWFARAGAGRGARRGAPSRATGRRWCGRGWPTWKGCHRRACSAT